MDAAASPHTRSARPDDTPIEANEATLAHELANCVQVITGNLELIAAHCSDEPTLRYVGNARVAAQQLTELTERLRSEH